jgi:prephenate dehydrogenase
MKIGIIGLGLMGGSIAKKLKLCKEVEKIIAYDKNIEDLKLAKLENIIDDYTTNIDVNFSNLDYIFICVPVKYTVSISKELEKHISSNCIVIDIGSTKGNIVPKLEKMNFEYVGTHPMVGKEKSGFKYSDSHLYDKSYFLITTTENTKADNIQKVEYIIKLLDAKPYIIPLNKHDFIVSVISHVPHIIAFSLVNMTKDLEDENNYLRTLAAGGFKDITRIASSDPTMWQNICLENSSEILDTISNFKKSLEKIENYIISKNDNELYNFIEESKKFRDSIDTIKKDNEICIKITNTPGELEKVISILSKNNINIINLSIQDDVDEKHGTLRLYFNNIDKKNLAYNILKEENII